MVVACCLQCDFDFSDSQFQLLPTKGLADRGNRLHLLLRCFSASQAKISEHHRLSVCCHSLEFVRCHFVSHLLLSAVFAIYCLSQLNLPSVVLKVFLLAHAGRLQINFKATGWVPTLELISYFCQLYVKLCASCILILVDSLSLERVRICGTLLVTNIVSEMVCPR